MPQRRAAWAHSSAAEAPPALSRRGGSSVYRLTHVEPIAVGIGDKEITKSIRRIANAFHNACSTFRSEAAWSCLSVK